MGDGFQMPLRHEFRTKEATYVASRDVPLPEIAALDVPLPEIAALDVPLPEIAALDGHIVNI
jgi:hypothetical protein